MTELTDDGFRWLENLDAAEATAWVQERNAETVAPLAHDRPFVLLRDEIRRILDADDRIPYPAWRGEHLYNFWRDAAHPRGLWRRTSLAGYQSAAPEWEILLDVDALAAEEDENWVFGGVTLLRPGYRRCLVSLSRGGSDAAVVREFDLDRRVFVTDGFNLPEAKSNVCWIDENHIYVGTDFGPGSLTTSGYPRVVRRWRRGTALAEAETVYEGQSGDVSAYASHDPTPGYPRDFVGRHLDFFRSENHLRKPDGELVRVAVPEDANWEAHRQWLLVRLRSPWTVNGVNHPAGALLVTRFDDFLAGGRDLTVLFEPDANTTLAGYAWTRDHLILSLLHDVRSRLVVLTPDGDDWRRRPLGDAAELDHAEILDTEPDLGDGYLLSVSGFVRSPTLHLGEVDGPVEQLKAEPPAFEADGATVRQFFATSDDGTRVPYFVVGDPAASGAPTLLTGYGGFEIPLTPGYDPVIGQGWLARGGTYVVANIRGGGEYGPDWHRSAMRERRVRAYEDFAAVAVDLVRRGITTPAALGIKGGSNGGLLMGVMLTRYPTLFGAVVAHVPLLDMRRYHLLLAGASWMAEYGDPDEADDWAYLREFSPYHQVRAGQPYPPVLFVTSTRDDRVHPGHARKMVARLREHGYDVSYYENVEGGHGAAADNEQRAFISTLALEFLWRRLTAAAPPAVPRPAGPAVRGQFRA